VVLLSNNKPEVKALIDEKKEAINNAIVAVEAKTTPHPKNPNTKILFLQTLVVLQEGGAKRGEPTKYEPEDMAKATLTTSVPHEQQEVRKTTLSPAHYHHCCMRRMPALWDLFGCFWLTRITT